MRSRLLHILAPQNRLLLVALLCGSTFLLFFRPESAWQVPMVWDDTCYFEWLNEAIGIHAPMCPAYQYFGHNYYFPGAPFAWTPLAWVAKNIAQATSLPTDSLVSIAVGISSFLMWCGSFLMISLIAVKRGIPEFRFPFLFLFATPVLHYAIVRTFMSHSAEFFLVTACLCALIHQRHLLAILLSLWLCATRLNDGPILFMLLGAWVDRWKNNEIALRERMLLKALFIIAGALALYVTKFAIFDGYAQLGPAKILGVLENVNLHELYRAMFGPFGLAWTGFAWLAILLTGLFNLRRLSWMARFGCFWVLITFILCIGWQGHGGDSFAYRYTIGSYGAAFLILTELLQKAPQWKPMVSRILGAQAALLTILTWCYNTQFHLTENAGLWFSQIVGSIQLLGVSALGVTVNYGLRRFGIQLPHEPNLKGVQVLILSILCISTLAALVFLYKKILATPVDTPLERSAA